MLGAGANARVTDAVLIVQTRDERVHIVFLVILGRKETREATPRETARDLGISRRTPDTSDMGTCEIMTVR